MIDYKLKYYYLASGMNGIAQEYPEKTIKAESKDRALYEYHKSNGIDFGSFEEFMKKEKYVREWATTGTVCVALSNELKGLKQNKEDDNT